MNCQGIEELSTLPSTLCHTVATRTALDQQTPTVYVGELAAAYGCMIDHIAYHVPMLN